MLCGGNVLADAVTVTTWFPFGATTCCGGGVITFDAPPQPEIPVKETAPQL